MDILTTEFQLSICEITETFVWTFNRHAVYNGSPLYSGCVFSLWLTAMIRIWYIFYGLKMMYFHRGPPLCSRSESNNSIKKRKFQKTPHASIPTLNRSGHQYKWNLSDHMRYRYHMSKNIIANMIHVSNQLDSKVKLFFTV